MSRFCGGASSLLWFFSTSWMTLRPSLQGAGKGVGFRTDFGSFPFMIHDCQYHDCQYSTLPVLVL